MENIAVLASGSGTNAENIMSFFENSKDFRIRIIISNKKDAFVLKRANKFGVENRYFPKSKFYEDKFLINFLKEKKIDFVILAGFLLLVPKPVISYYKNRIVNIHPALLPKYGGKGMYGMRVHEAVINNNERQSGITIHFVNENYDEGGIIFQAVCDITVDDTAESLATKIHELEYQFFPKVINDVLLKTFI